MKKTLVAALTLLSALPGTGAETRRPPFQGVVDYVDIQRFLGSWYVIALMPSILEKNAVNGVETYSLDDRGNIRVAYVLRRGSPNGRRTVMHQKGWIMDKAKNSVWEIQPIWPLRLPYLIIDLAEDYRYTVIGTDNFKYLWIMARKPVLAAADYDAIVARLARRGYNVADITMMPQVW